MSVPSTGTNPGPATGIGQPGSGTTSGGVAVLTALSGRSFRSTNVSGRDLVKDSTVVLSFAQDAGPGVVTASAGCNTMSGQAVLDAGVLRVPQLASTAMGCAQKLMDQDTWLAGLLSKGVDLDVRGNTLVLAADGITITLVDRTVLEPDLPLAGTVWTLDGIVTGAAVSRYADVTATMTIDGGKISYLACNSHSGPITVTGNSATAGPMLATTMACADARADVEKAMQAVLDGTFTFTVEGDHLTVTGRDGRGLTFVGAAGGSPTSASEAPATPVPPVTSPSAEPTAPTSLGTPVSPATARPMATDDMPTRPAPGRHDSIPPQPSPHTAILTY
jgi:heat shock protein HslJ